MIDAKAAEGLRVEFHTVHPLLFFRSAERARSPGELFDILSAIPAEMPLVWDEGARRWTITDDPFLSKDFYAGPENGD